jgi:rhamnose transport system permease protein
MRRHRLQTSEWVLVAALVAEVVVFTVVAPNFFTLANGLEVTRVSVELGLLALALTPILVAGGIDLSVGSLMGLAAVAFGAAHQVWHAPIPVAMLTALAVGIAGGALNAFLVAWLQVPPLIVTLGTFALFRGIAEGVTQAAVNYSGFPAGFLALGQGYLGGIVPAQVPLFAIVALAYAALLHRSVIGRALYAIGFSAPGARYAGIPVKQRVAPIYLLSGVMASVAAIVYAAHLGQARADAGTGYELDAIAAVVLGGTSVFGGRGTIGGTLLGLFVLAVLKNGLYLSALSSELVGVLTGALLVSTIAIDRLSNREFAGVARATQEGVPVRNSQVAVLCAAILRRLVSRGRHQRLARPVDHLERRRCATRERLRFAACRCDDAEGQGRSLFRQLPRRCRGGREGTWRRSDLGRPHQPRRRAAERAGRELDYARRGCDRGCGRESSRHLDRAPQGAQPGDPRGHVGCRRRA